MNFKSTSAIHSIAPDDPMMLVPQAHRRHQRLPRSGMGVADSLEATDVQSAQTVTEGGNVYARHV